MNYLARLAAQTGLTAAPPPPPLPQAGIEVIDEIVEAPSPAPAFAASGSEDPPPSPAPQPGVRQIVERVVFEAPPGRPDPTRRAEAPPEHLATASLPAAEPHRDGEAESADPTVPAPAVSREMRIRQVLEWVAQNDRLREAAEAPEVVSAKLAPPAPRMPAPEPASPRLAQLPPTEPPALEIALPPPAPEVAPPPLAEPLMRTPAPLDPPRPRSRIQSPEPETHLVEERIDISIGTIRLDVTPPPAAPAPPRAAPTLPAPAPSPASGASSTSRLRRRFIRI